MPYNTSPHDTLFPITVPVHTQLPVLEDPWHFCIWQKQIPLPASLGDANTTYYVFECCGYFYGTVGSLDVDINMNVLKEDSTPIANLFAVGQDSEGVANKDGKAYSPWGGQAQSWTFVSGKIASETSAKLAK